MIDSATEIATEQTFKNGTTHIRVEDKITGRFIRYERQLDEDPEMHFGKYKGMKFSKIQEENEGYFDWLLTQEWLKDNFRNTVVHYLDNCSA
tara:strand:- start:413 stop:688 length:276 start_codon:yes stop_codon:yes gene_type:complete